MPTQRQQRTNFARTKVKRGAPPAVGSIRWMVVAYSGTSITMQLSGSEGGMVLNGVPAFKIVGTDVVAVGSELIGMTLTITMSEDVVEGTEIELALPSIAIRNEFGAMLAAGIVLLVPAEPPETETVLDYIGHGGTLLELSMTEGGPDFYANDTLTVEDETTPQTSNGASIQSGNLVVTFPAGLPAGGTVSWGANASGFVNSTGGALLPGSLVLP